MATDSNAGGGPLAEPVNSGEATDLRLLRELLLAPEQRQLGELRERLEDPRIRASDVSAVLPEALTLSAAHGNKLTAALTPSVEDALKSSVRRNPQILTNAIYPVIGATIRKAIASALRSMVSGLNATLERSFSIEGLKWRIEALRTGKPFGEIALLHSLVFRVEQVLLIHEESGILLQHVVAPESHPREADLVAGMLNAIRDFVKDSFRLEQGAALETMKAGDLTLWVEVGPRAVFVGVIRGEADAGLRPLFQGTLEKVHREFDRELEEFSGDAAVFDAVRPDLESCLKSELVATAKPGRNRALLVTAGLVVGIAVISGFVLRDRMKWSAYLDRLAAEPGIVVIEQRGGFRNYTVRGLRDPLAADPVQLLKSSGLEESRVTSQWQTFQSAVPSFVLARAANLLAPPKSVQLNFSEDTLKVAGVAPRAWAARARQLGILIPGVVRYDESLLQEGELVALSSTRADIERERIRFETGSSRISDGQEAVIARVAELARRLVPEFAEAGFRGRLEVHGHTDSAGHRELNHTLALSRARAVSDRLQAMGAPASIVTTVVVPEEVVERSVTFKTRTEKLETKH